MSSSQEEPPSSSAEPSRRGRLQKFDTSAFTLHQHCGTLSAAVQKCLQQHGVQQSDPVALEEEGWTRGTKCRGLWEEYRECGRAFFTSVSWAQRSCADEAAAWRTCTSSGSRDCEALEATAAVKLCTPLLSPPSPYRDRMRAVCVCVQLAVLRCATAKIRMRMSGASPPDLAE